MHRRIILRPLFRRGAGSGHMRRCCELAARLREYSDVDIVLIVDNPLAWADELSGFPERVLLMDEESLLNQKENAAEDTLILVDPRQSTEHQIHRFSRHGTPVLLDDDGPGRHLAPFVIDSIPGPRKSLPNLFSTGFLSLPPRTREPNPEGPILVSFGGQDSSCLSDALIDALMNDEGIDPNRISKTLASHERQMADLKSNVQILDASQGLKKHLGRYGLVFCSFGLSALEALACGCAVITVEPSMYHWKLSKRLGLPSLGYARSAKLSPSQRRTLKKLLHHQNYAKAKPLRIITEGREHGDLPELLMTLRLPPPRCLACGLELPPIIERFPRRSYYRCRKCRMVGMYNFDSDDENYGPSYFNQQYRQQYGRSYLEDFDNIKAMAKPRLRLIKHFHKGLTLLDIGCAYGPFLQAAAEEGFRVYGSDISEAAVTYVQSVLGHQALCAPFLDMDQGQFALKRFNVITLWYVIEHFPRLDAVLKKVNQLLETGGILAFSTPNFRGISGLKSRRDFLDKSPKDHYSIWFPRSARKILSLYGFKVRRIRVSGHHPERFIAGLKNTSLLYKIVLALSRIFRMGDTFEVYAVKVSS